MTRPAAVDGIERVKWNYGGRNNDYAAVFHSAWQSQDGRHAVTLCNWTKEEQCVTIRDNRYDFAQELKLTVRGEETTEEFICNNPKDINISIPAFGCVIIT
jgi:hypothetical protein